MRNLLTVPSRCVLFIHIAKPIPPALVSNLTCFQKLDSANVFGALVHSGPVIVGLIDMKDIVRFVKLYPNVVFPTIHQEFD